MGLRCVEYRRRQWVLRYRDPWSGKQRIKSFATEGEARQFESVQAQMHIRERALMRRAKRRMSSASATKDVYKRQPVYATVTIRPFPGYLSTTGRCV